MSGRITKKDALLASTILNHLEAPIFEADFVLEGGGIHVDGCGTLMAVAPCLLDPNRNPGLTVSDLEILLSAYLGVTSFIWLDHGLENDETAGHIDNVACFAAPGVVLVHDASDPVDGNYERSKENIARLKKSKDAAGRSLEVIPIEQPGYREGKNGRLALTYINFYLPNKGVVMPRFDDPADENAYEIISRVFPDRRIVRLPALDILYGGGGIHCITQQQPAV